MDCLVHFRIVWLATVRWFPHITNKNTIIHTLSGCLILVLTIHYTSGYQIVYESFSAVMSLKKWTSFPNQGIHVFAGQLVIFFTIIVILGGFLNLMAKSCVRWNTRFILRTKFLHKIFGFLIWILGLVACASGLWDYSWHYKE